MCSLHVRRGEWKQHRVFVLKMMSHTHGATITNCCWPIGIFSSSQELKSVEEAKRYHPDIRIVGVSSTKRCSYGTVDLDVRWKLYSGGNPTVVYVLKRVCMVILTGPGYQT